MEDFVSGTKTFFVGTNATTGWTKDTTYNDYTLRVVSGSITTGGTTNFSSVFTSRSFSATAPFSGLTSGSTVLTGATLPQHTHPYSGGRPAPAPALLFGTPAAPFPLQGNMGTTTSGTGYAPGINPTNTLNLTAAGHTHPFGTISASINGTIDLSVKYLDVIIVTKD